MGTGTLPNIDQTADDFDTQYDNQFVTTKANYATDGITPIGPLPTSEIERLATAEYGNLVDDAIRKLQRRTSSTVRNIREFGAVGDGSANDTAAVQAAIDAVVADGGGVVYAPAGAYSILATLEYTTDVSIVGAGPEATVFLYGGTGYCFDSSTPGVRTYNAMFRDFRVVCTPAGAGCIHLQDHSHGLLFRVFVSGVIPGTIDGFHISGTSNGFSVYNSFYHCRGAMCDSAFSVTGIGSNETHILDCRGNVSTTSVNIVDANHTTIMFGAFESGTNGVAIESTASALADGTTIIGNRFETNSGTNILVNGTASNVRHTNVGANQHVDGTAYSALTDTQFLNLFGDTGTGQLLRVINSTVTAGAGTSLLAQNSNASPLLVRHPITGVGSPDVLQVSCGRATSNAIAIYDWDGTTDTLVASIDALGNASLNDADFSGDVELDDANAELLLSGVSGRVSLPGAAGEIRLGDGVTSGNRSVVWQKGDTFSMTTMVFRNGTATADNRFLLQFSSAEDLRMLSADAGGVAHTVVPFALQWNANDGRTQVAIARPVMDAGTAQVVGDVSLDANWGAGATVDTNDATDARGSIEITAAGTPAANPTFTITFTDGAWDSGPPFVTMARNDNSAPSPVVAWPTWTVTNSAITVTFNGTPTAGQTYRFEWTARG